MGFAGVCVYGVSALCPFSGPVALISTLFLLWCSYRYVRYFFCGFVWSFLFHFSPYPDVDLRAAGFSDCQVVLTFRPSLSARSMLNLFCSPFSCSIICILPHIVLIINWCIVAFRDLGDSELTSPVSHSWPSLLFVTFYLFDDYNVAPSPPCPSTNSYATISPNLSTGFASEVFDNFTREEHGLEHC